MEVWEGELVLFPAFQSHINFNMISCREALNIIHQKMLIKKMLSVFPLQQAPLRCLLEPLSHTMCSAVLFS